MWHQLSTKLVQFMAPEHPVRPPDVRQSRKKVEIFKITFFPLQPPVEEIIEDEKQARKSPPDSDKSKDRDRDISLSMAPLPIPLPLGFGG